MDIRQLLAVWLDWGVFLGFLVSLAAAFWVFYDSQQKDIEAMAWKALVVVTTVLIVPSLVFRLSPQTMLSLANAVEPLSYLGILASVVAVIGLIAYVVDSGRQSNLAYDQGGVGGTTAPDMFESRTPLGTPAPSGQQSIPGSPGPTRPLDEPPTHDEMSAVGRVAQSPATVVLNRKPPAMAWLVYRSGPRVGKTEGLSESTDIGREAMDNDIILEDTSVSRRHARVKKENGQFYLYDLASANGTFVKDRTTSEWKKLDSKLPLTDGDVVKFGESVMSFMQIKDQ